jgi:hypothetical protein
MSRDGEGISGARLGGGRVDARPRPPVSFVPASSPVELGFRGGGRRPGTGNGTGARGDISPTGRDVIGPVT